MTEDISKLRKRKFSFVIWCDDKNFQKQMIEVNESNTAWVLHDKDLDENGELKKAHVHVVLVLQNARTLKSIADQFLLKDQEGNNCYGKINIIDDKKKGKSLKGAYLYLIHCNAPDKYQYSMDDIGGKLKSDAVSCIETYLNGDNDNIVLNIKTWIDNSDHYISYNEILTYCCDYGYANKLISRWYFWRGYIEEHNYLIKTENNHC